MRTKLQAVLAVLPAMALAFGASPALAAEAEDEGIEVETRELPEEARAELSRAEPERGDAPEVEVPESDRDRGDVEFDDFYAGLANDGNWVETPEYGWVWVPYRQTQVSDWRPYLYGQWVWTRHGWTWVSEEPFGWATYHYGRWSYAPAYGWYWVPGYTWGPAWVVWRYGDAAVGWAPLYPGYVTWSTAYPFYWDHWIFIGPTHFYAYPVHRHWYHGHDRVVHHYHGTHWAHHWHQRNGGSHRVYAGPRRSYVERVSSRPVRTASLETSSRPAASRYTATPSGGRVSMYRPDARGAAKPTGPRPPAGASVKAGGGRRDFVGSGLDRPRSQAATLDRGNRGSPTVRGAVPEGARPRGDAAGSVRSPRQIERPSSPGPGYRQPSTGGKPGTKVTPAPQNRPASPKLRRPSDGGPSSRRPGGSVAPSTPSRRDRADAAPLYRPPAGSSGRSYADARPRTSAPAYRGSSSFGAPTNRGGSYGRPQSPSGYSPARPSAPSGGRGYSAPSGGGRGYSAPSGGGRSFSPARPSAPSGGRSHGSPSRSGSRAPRPTRD